MKRFCPKCQKDIPSDDEQVKKLFVSREVRYLTGNLTLTVNPSAYLKIYNMVCLDKDCNYQRYLERTLPANNTLAISERYTDNPANFNRGKKTRPLVSVYEPYVGQFTKDACVAPDGSGWFLHKHPALLIAS